MYDPNGYYQEWLGSTTKNRLRDSALDFPNISGFDPLDVFPTYASGATVRYHIWQIFPTEKNLTPDLALVSP